MPGPEPAAGADLSDRSTQDFGAGTADAGLYLTETSTGPEVILTPAAIGEFGGDSLPSQWYYEPWKEGGQVEHRDSVLLLEAATVALHGLYPSERSLEFVATFQKRPHQHIGFGTNFRTVPWITFSTKFGHGLYARTNFVIPEENRLATSLLGSPHRFRIEWNVLEVEFFVDGRRVAHQLVPMVGYMRPLASNASAGPDLLAVEWMRMSPYAAEGTFTSRVHDAGTTAIWAPCEVDAETPRHTTVAVVLRCGDTDAPDRTWTPWSTPDEPLTGHGVQATQAGHGVQATQAGHGVQATQAGRFAQYRATLRTQNSRWTPVLRGVTLRYSAADGSASSSSSSSSSQSSSSSSGGPGCTGGNSGA